MSEKKILVFLSRPNPFTKQQQLFLSELQRLLNNYDIETVTLQADNYDLTDSINYLIRMIKQCYGIIIVGFRQIFIEKGSKKKGGTPDPLFYYPQEIDLSGKALTSSFCHIEGTIGLINNLPLLIINEKGLWEDGIMTGGKFSVKTNPFDLSRIDEFFNDATIKRQIDIWIGKVTEGFLFLNSKWV